jgi:hypothetical protein
VRVIDAATQKPIVVHVRPKALVDARAAALLSSRAAAESKPAPTVTLTGFDSHGSSVVVTLWPPRVDASVKPTTVRVVDEAGNVQEVGVGKATSATQVGGFLSRSADFNKAGGTVGLWGSRIKPQLKLIKAQRLGHGTGTMTLGSEYASSSATFQGESQYSKLAWELGLPGFVLYVWFVVAFAFAALLGVIASRGAGRIPATVGFGLVSLAAVWAVFTFAPDYPVFAIFIYLLGGYAVSMAGASGASGPERAHAADDRSPASLPASAGAS